MKRQMSKFDMNQTAKKIERGGLVRQNHRKGKPDGVKRSDRKSITRRLKPIFIASSLPKKTILAKLTELSPPTSL